jgi:hypothetical protein
MIFHKIDLFLHTLKKKINKKKNKIFPFKNISYIVLKFHNGPYLTF